VLFSETRLVKYYLSGSDAFRLKLWLQPLGHPASYAHAEADGTVHAAEDDE